MSDIESLKRVLGTIKGQARDMRTEKLKKRMAPAEAEIEVSEPTIDLGKGDQSFPEENVSVAEGPFVHGGEGYPGGNGENPSEDTSEFRKGLDAEEKRKLSAIRRLIARH